MKIDLTHRDIEMILSVVYETAGKDTEGVLPGGFSIDDLVLIDKLEAALKRVEFFGEDTIHASVSDLSH
ncbi:MAG: hypothetical protein NTU66_03445 [Elusimicrobia bacterium]|nr:hypothetical protein [Elusimicrobiota bacterium]